MKLSENTLKEILVGSGFVPEAEFDEAARSAKNLGKKVEDVLFFRGLISEDALGKLIAEYLKVPFADIAHKSIPDEILSLIPEKIARSYRMLPFAKEGKELKLAMEDPNDFEALEFARRQTRLKIAPHYASSAGIRKSLGQYRRNIRKDFDKVIKRNIQRASPEKDLAKAAEKLPIVKILDTILGYAAAERASDIHIETLLKEVIVRFRVDGILRDIIKLPRGIEAALVARVKILSNLKIDEHRIPQDGRYKFTIDDDVIALRISIIPGFYGENVVMRLLPETARPLSMEELGLSGYGLETVRKNIVKPHGMILVTGPTGSGKTTTLYSILNILNTVEVKICTIEDPIEYGINRVTQIQVNPKAGLTFATGLRSLLRHDPDIIMVGEIRDEETAEIAVHSALTGHLVLSTLHTNDAAGAIPRFLDMGVEGYLVASTINVILAQRLVRRICSNCIEEYKPEKSILKRLASEFDVDLKDQKFYRGKGCDLCHQSGYSGRIGIFEVLSVTDKIRSMVVGKTTSEDIQKQAESEGMVSMAQDGLNKMAAGLTTIEEVLRAVRED
jgi:type IV pilus assembly protein PilB